MAKEKELKARDSEIRAKHNLTERSTAKQQTLATVGKLRSIEAMSKKSRLPLD